MNVATIDEYRSGAFDARFSSRGQTFSSVSSGVRVECSSLAHHTVLRPALNPAVTRFAGDSQSSVSGTFAGAIPAVAPFALTNKLERTQLTIAPSLTLSRATGLGVRLGAFVHRRWKRRSMH